MAFIRPDAEALGLQILQNIRQYNEQLATGQEALGDISSILQSCKQLEALVTPPEVWNLQIATAYQRSTSVCILLDWKVLDLLLKEGGTASLDKLTQILGFSKPLIRCILREAVLYQILDETSPEVYRLNRHSECLLEGNVTDSVHFHTDVALRAAAFLPEYIAQVGGRLQDSPPTTAFQMAFQTDKPFYEFNQYVDKARGERFDKFMEYSRSNDKMPVEMFFPFNELKPGALVVDVGGGKGQRSIRIAKQERQLSFIVQDYEGKRPSAGSLEMEKIPERVKYQQHNYFNLQPVKGADVYLFGNILMDLTASDARKVLRNVVEVMSPNESVLLIDDTIDPGSSRNLCLENAKNLHMFSCFGTLFRTMEEWETLFSEACSQLEVVDRRRDGGIRVSFRLIKKGMASS